MPLYADTDYDPSGPSSCSWSERGAHYRRCLFGCFGCSSSSFRPTTTTAVRWLGFFYIFCIVISFINCLLILIRIYVLAIVGSDTFVFSFVCMYLPFWLYQKLFSLYIYSFLHIMFSVSTMCKCMFFFSIEQLNCYNWTIELLLLEN